MLPRSRRDDAFLGENIGLAVQTLELRSAGIANRVSSLLITTDNNTYITDHE